ncbi:MAG: hypothetical protein LIO77_08845 [Rikenellaceae bacterium]|nr:hypothetical protein [Rikenellaceae bacterium]
MGLKGYTRRAGRRNGGIVKVAVAPMEAVASVGLDRVAGSISGIELSEGESFALYNFKEDSARLVETTLVTGGFPLVRRELSLLLERLDENERASAAELLKRSAKGYLIVVQNGCGTSFVLGYSLRFGDSFPMKAARAEASTGAAPEDTAAERLVFYNEDTRRPRSIRESSPTRNNGMQIIR